MTLDPTTRYTVARTPFADEVMEGLLGSPAPLNEDNPLSGDWFIWRGNNNWHLQNQRDRRLQTVTFPEFVELFQAAK